MPKKNHYLEIACFFLFLIFCVAASSQDNDDDPCLTSFCNKNKKLFPIHYPFKLENQKLITCDSHRAINLTCSTDQLTESIPILNLPNYGDFYVRNISYSSQKIHLYDPNNCLPARLMMTDSNLSSPSYNPLKAIRYENYTFLSCSRDVVNIGLDISNSIIHCLSNSTSYTLSTASTERAQEMISSGYCYMIKTLQIPVSSLQQFENNGFDGELVLSWKVPKCLNCSNPELAGLLGLFWFYCLPMSVILVVFFLCNYACKYAQRRSRDAARARQTITNTAVARPAPAAVIIPAPVIRNNIPSRNDHNCSEIVVGESGRIPGPNATVCPICLEDYFTKDTVKCISECQHCFHPKCIEEWLKSHDSCPICRNSV